MPVFSHADPTFFDDLTSPSMRFSREIGKEQGVDLATVLLGDAGDAPVAMLLELPPGHQLHRHAHATHRVEVVVRGSLVLGDGTVLVPGDVWTSRPGELYGPHTAGPDGVLTVEIFASASGLAPTPDPDVDASVHEIADDIRHRTEVARAER